MLINNLWRKEFCVYWRTRDVLEIEVEEFLSLQEEVIKAVESVTSTETMEIANQTDVPT